MPTIVHQCHSCGDASAFAIDRDLSPHERRTLIELVSGVGREAYTLKLHPEAFAGATRIPFDAAEELAEQLRAHLLNHRRQHHPTRLGRILFARSAARSEIT